jgi:hypothetical protein
MRPLAGLAILALLSAPVFGAEHMRQDFSVFDATPLGEQSGDLRDYRREANPKPRPRPQGRFVPWEARPGWNPEWDGYVSDEGPPPPGFKKWAEEQEARDRAEYEKTPEFQESVDHILEMLRRGRELEEWRARHQKET